MGNQDENIETLRAKAAMYERAARQLEEIKPLMKDIQDRQVKELAKLLTTDEGRIRTVLERFQRYYPNDPIELLTERVISFLRIYEDVRWGRKEK